jgi:MoaE-MoaD fusion protein
MFFVGGISLGNFVKFRYFVRNCGEEASSVLTVNSFRRPAVTGVLAVTCRASYNAAMQVRVLFFGRLKEIVGFADDTAELSEGARVEDLFARYGNRFPALAQFRPSVAAAVNQEYAEWRAPLHDNDEVAFLPPVSGGEDTIPDASAASRDQCAIMRAPIRSAELAEQVKAPADGAVVVFEGIVRNHSRGKQTLYLIYEAYENMALAKMREICAEMRRLYQIDRVLMMHRLGRLEIGETSILIAVSSSHRAAAFDASRFAIDTFKRTVPIWKQEYFRDGAVWVDGEFPAAQNLSHAQPIMPESESK